MDIDEALFDAQLGAITARIERERRRWTRLTFLAGFLLGVGMMLLWPR